MSKFTPGKWEADVLYGDHHAVFAKGHVVADCFGSEANARLIASAPKMYELLKIWTKIQSQPPLMIAQRKARELIACIDGKEPQE